MLEKFAKVLKLRKRKFDDTNNKFDEFVPARGEPIYDEKTNELKIGQVNPSSGKLRPIKDIKPIGYIEKGTYVKDILVNGVKYGKNSSDAVDLRIPTMQYATFPAGWSKGDVNHNGLLDVDDLVANKKGAFLHNTSDLLSEKYGRDTVNFVMDIDGDGSIDPADYLLLKRAFEGTYAFAPVNVFTRGQAINPHKNWLSYVNTSSKDMGVYMSVDIDGGVVGSNEVIMVMKSPGLEGMTFEKLNVYDVGKPVKTVLICRRKFCPVIPTSIVIVRNISTNSKNIENNIIVV